MKQLLMTLLLSAASLGAFAQFEYQYTTNDTPPLKNDGKRIPVSPAFTEPYTVTSDPACYMYKTRKGVNVLECPGILFAKNNAPVLSSVNPKLQQPNTLSGDKASPDEPMLNLQSSRSFAGNYPKVCKRDPHMPANAVPAWPTSEYTPTQDPSCAPCYKYKRHGITVMECSYLRFPAER